MICGHIYFHRILRKIHTTKYYTEIHPQTSYGILCVIFCRMYSTEFFAKPNDDAHTSWIHNKKVYVQYMYSFCTHLPSYIILMLRYAVCISNRTYAQHVAQLIKKSNVSLA